MNKVERLDDYDFIKGVLILFVVYGHFCMYFSGVDYEKTSLTTYIRYFQMPLFIFISGYFQKSIITITDLINKLSKLIRHIGVPFVSWFIIAFVLKIIYYKLTKDCINIFEAISLTHGIASLYWYLGCLFICSVYYYIIDYIYNYNNAIGVVAYIMGGIAVVYTYRYISFSVFMDIFHFRCFLQTQ